MVANKIVFSFLAKQDNGPELLLIRATHGPRCCFEDMFEFSGCTCQYILKLYAHYLLITMVLCRSIGPSVTRLVNTPMSCMPLWQKMGGLELHYRRSWVELVWGYQRQP